MRQGRIKAPAEHALAYYHCVSRVVDRRMVLGDLEKDRFEALMWEYATFCGVNIVTHSVLSNHFHLVVEVPRRPDVLPDDEELIRRIEGLTGLAGDGNCRQVLQQFREQGHHEAAEAFRARYFARMWDISAYMKLLKQRFTQWFNRTRGRKGTLWESRFKSVLVEGNGTALASVAAYIDLNSVRAGLGDDPKNYRWSGYGAAMAGNRQAQEGLRIAVAAAHGVPVETLEGEDVLAGYRVWLYLQGEENEGTDAEGRPVRKGFSREEVARVVAEKGRVRPAEYLRMRVRYFTDGAVLGTREFVNEVFQKFRSRFGPRRRDGARRMRGLDTTGSTELYTLRDLRLRVFG